jgi:outer membrane protein TolC
VVAQLAGVEAIRASREYAIAVLTGYPPPADLSLPFSPLPKDVPVFPPGLPSTSLERRSDVASAESAMRDENAQNGIELAIYYPTISLPAAGLSALVPAGQFGLVRRVG